MGEVLIAALGRVLPWLIGFLVLGGNVKSVEQSIEGFGSAITQGPVNTAVNAWVKVAVIAAGLGIGVWIIETQVAHKMGQEVDAPPVAPIPVAAPPTFGTSGGYTATAGPLTVHSGVTTSGGGGGTQYVATPARRARRSSGFSEAA